MKWGKSVTMRFVEIPMVEFIKLLGLEDGETILNVYVSRGGPNNWQLNISTRKENG